MGQWPSNPYGAIPASTTVYLGLQRSKNPLYFVSLAAAGVCFSWLFCFLCFTSSVSLTPRMSLTPGLSHLLCTLLMFKGNQRDFVELNRESNFLQT